jgi:predicted nucleotidyltransferase
MKRKKHIGLTRATADRLIAEVIERGKRVNRCKRKYLFRVARVEVFGSYLSDKDRLGDLDIAVLMVSRIDASTEEWRLRSFLEQQLAPAGANTTTVVYWPQLRILKQLKGGSTGISIHDMWDLDQLKKEHGTPSRVVFDAWRPPV